MKWMVVWFWLIMGVLSAGSMLGAGSGVTVAVYTRHTLRGVEAEIPPNPGSVPGTSLRWRVPMLAYEMDATEDGLEIARRMYPAGLKAAMKMALAAIGERGGFDGRWDEVRADLSTQRTYWTAVKIREGLGGGMALTGCPVRGGEIADPVTNEGWVKRVLGEAQIERARRSLPPGAVERVRTAAADFLKSLQETVWGRAERVKLPPVLEDAAAKTPLYSAISLLGVSLEMAAAGGPPVPVVFGVEPKEGGQVSGVIARGLSLAASRWVLDFPATAADLAAWGTLRHVARLPDGRREILVGHDEQIFCIRQSLGLVDFRDDPASARVYPMETLIFARNAERAVVAGMRMVYERDGRTRGKFTQAVLWQGTRAEWDALVQAVRARAASSPLTARWVDHPAPATVEVQAVE